MVRQAQIGIGGDPVPTHVIDHGRCIEGDVVEGGEGVGVKIDIGPRRRDVGSGGTCIVIDPVGDVLPVVVVTCGGTHIAQWRVASRDGCKGDVGTTRPLITLCGGVGTPRCTVDVVGDDVVDKRDDNDVSK